ncbi:hypothetical protein FGIG_01184 [Fasciola gigantica]|uniref:Uncharacterized protein n=1 Tax=Fasciola gigantica TaxID=46835 RepID=A0A504Z1A9_FASGI|nr:hypothetical protein FGIG_01184 [Fasciola gigantica]
MTMVLRCNKEYNLKELRRTLSQKMINLGGSGHVGKVKLIYQDSQSKLTLFQMDFDVSDMFDLELDGPGVEVLADEMSCNLSTSERLLTRLRISIDAEVQRNCQPVLWHFNLLNSSSDQFEQQRKVVENQVFIVLGQWNNLRFLNSSTVAYFYPRERQDVDKNSIKLSSISESFSEHLFKQRQCERNAHSLVNAKYEIGHWKGLEALLKSYTRITLIGSLQRNGANAIWNANYGHKWSTQYRDAVTVINHQMNRVLELKKIDVWRSQFTLDHFFRHNNRVKVVLHFYVPTSSLEDPTRNENLAQDLRSVLHNLKSRDGLQATDVDLQGRPPKRTTDDSAKETEMEYILDKKKIALP